MDVAARCPRLTAWMGAAPATHPLQEIIANVTISDEPQSVGMEMLKAFEAIINTLENANPLRLATERTDFQNAKTFNDLLIVRAELVVAAKLARAGVPFKFGGRNKTPLPDLILAQSNLAIEVKNRRLDGLRDLNDELNTALIQANAAVTVHIGTDEWILCIKPDERKKIIAQTLQRVSTGMPETFSVVLDHPWATRTKPRVSVQIFPHPPLVEHQRVFIQNAFATSAHFADVEDEVIATLIADEQKLKQAQRMPTILLIDIGRAGLSWIRPERIWAQMLASRIPESTPFIGVATMVPRLTTPDVVLALALRPNVCGKDRANVESLAQSLDLTGAGGSWSG